MEFKVDLNKVTDVKKFVEKASLYDADITVRNADRKWEIDGKSIMGLFSLDLSKPVLVEINDDFIANDFMEEAEELVVE